MSNHLEKQLDKMGRTLRKRVVNDKEVIDSVPKKYETYEHTQSLFPKYAVRIDEEVHLFRTPKEIDEKRDELLKQLGGKF